MSDEQLPTPEGGAEESVDWQKRYTDTHAEYNRLNETLKRFEADPNSVVEFIEKHHPTLIAADEAEDDGTEWDDTPAVEDTPDYEAVQKEVQELRTWQKEQMQAQERATFDREWSGWEDHVKNQASEKGIELKPRDIKALKLDSAQNNAFPVDPAKANEIFEAYVSEYFSEPVEPAKRPRAPHVPANGKPNTGQPDWSKMSQIEIDRYMTERAMELSRQS